MKSSLNWGDAAVLFAYHQYGCSGFLMSLLMWWTPYGHFRSEAVEFARLRAPHSKLVRELDLDWEREREREREREYMLNKVFFGLDFVHRSWHPTSCILQERLSCCGNRHSLASYTFQPNHYQNSRFKQICLHTLSLFCTLLVESIDLAQEK
jgi:hypothetical protein